MKNNNKNAVDAAHAHTNLNAFAVVARIMEGGFLYGSDNKAARKIIAICEAEQRRQLNLFDKAMAKVAP
jgi:hypothetical protein